MSIEAKQILLKELECVLADKLTAIALEDVIASIEQRMIAFTIEMDPEHTVENGFNELMDIFMETKRIEGRSEKTIARYQYVIGRLRDDMNMPISDYTAFTIRSWLSKEKERGISDRTLNGYREVFSSFFGWLHKEGLLKTNPCANVAPIKCKKKIQLPYSEVDLERLKECCTTNRDKAIVVFLLSTGCRVSEMCSLNRDNIDFINKECTVLGKGNKERAVFMDEVTAMHLRRYLNERKDMESALFVGRGSRRLMPGGVRALLKRVAKKADVNTKVYPHRFRRTMATTLIDHGMQIQDVASLLGHEKLDTTMTYVYISKENVKNAYMKYA